MYHPTPGLCVSGNARKTSTDPTGLFSPKGKYNGERGRNSRCIDSSGGAKEAKVLSFAWELGEF